MVWPAVQKFGVLVPPFTVNRPEFGLTKYTPLPPRYTPILDCNCAMLIFSRIGVAAMPEESVLRFEEMVIGEPVCQWLNPYMAHPPTTLSAHRGIEFPKCFPRPSGS